MNIRPRLVLSLAVALFVLTVTPPAEAASSSLQVRQMVYTGATPTAPVLPPQASSPTLGNGPIVGALDALPSLEQPSWNQSLPAALLSQIEDLLQAVRRLARTEFPSQPTRSSAPASRTPVVPTPVRATPAVPLPDIASAPGLPTLIATRSSSTPAVSPGFPIHDLRTNNAPPPGVLAYPFIPPVLRFPIAAPVVASWLGADGPEPPLIDAASIGLTGLALALFLRCAWVLLTRRGRFQGIESVR